jgi:hypothetical protein
VIPFQVGFCLLQAGGNIATITTSLELYVGSVMKPSAVLI